MYRYGVFFLLLSFLGNGSHSSHVRLVDTVAKFFEKYDNSKIVYFIVECDSSSLENAVDVVEKLSSKWLAERINVITISYSQRTGSKSTIFTNNLHQLEEALEQYSCNSTLTYNNETPRPDNFLSILSSIDDQTHYNETIFLFTNNERDEFWPDMLKRKLIDKRIQINVVIPDSAIHTNQLANTVRHLGGQIFPYRVQEPKSWSPAQFDLQYQSPDYTYKVNAIKKDNLMQNSRTVFSLPASTSNIILTIQGPLQKALLISPSGVIINLLPTQTQYASTPFERLPMTSEPIINFKLPISESPADWILSANGIKYNATMTMMVKSRSTMNYANENYQSRDNNYDTMNMNSFPYRSNFEVNQVREEDFQTNWPMKRYDNGRPATYPESNNKPILYNTGQERVGVQPPSNPLNEQAMNTNSISTIIDVDVASTFYVYPGEEARIIFNVRNNKEVPSKYVFNCHYMHQMCTVYPVYANLLPQEHIQIFVTIRASGSDGSSSIVGLISMSESIIDKKVHLFVGRPRSDRKKPDIDYEYNGNCDDANSGNTCQRKRWSANVIAQDKDSGLLNLWSEPPGLIYTSEFIVGTRESVVARYTSTCCNPKVDILASDLLGNTYRITLNVEHQFLSVIEIIAIILGVIILALLVAGIIYGIMRWRRKNRERSFIGRSTTNQRYNADQ